MRAVIYARYSSDLQRQASIEDQIEVCRRYIERQPGWRLTQTYDDAAISGSSTLMRPGFQKLLSDAQAGRFDVVVCEALDRLGRNLSDVAGFFDKLAFKNVQVHAASVGQLTAWHVGVMGTMAQMQIADIRDKTRRGLAGRIRAGKSAGGLAYGYDVVPNPDGRDGGDRRINEAEAAVVRRIFRDYATGEAPRGIAADLNAEGVPGPGGRPWGDTTIRGQADRGTGILNNSLYIGQLSWNRCSYVKDPSTGRRVARPNPVEQHEIIPVPELRIIDDEVWAQVRARQSAVRTEMGKDDAGNALNRAHRRKFLLSGLLTCGCCGAGYAVLAQDRYGCATRRSKGTCDNGRTITRQQIESRVLDGLKDRLLTPELIAIFIEEFQQDIARLRRESAGTQTRLTDQLSAVKRKLEGVLRAIENGAWNDTLKQRLNELEAQQKDLQAQADVAGKPEPVVHLHPNAAELYATKVADLQTALNDPAVRAEATDALRLLIERIVLTPDDAAPDGLAR